MTVSNREELQWRRWSVWHVLAVLLAFAVCTAVFRYTGDSDLFLAIGSGLGTGMLAWLLAHLHRNRRIGRS